jgi:hypothetical protein
LTVACTSDFVLHSKPGKEDGTNVAGACASGMLENGKNQRLAEMPAKIRKNQNFAIE